MATRQQHGDAEKFLIKLMKGPLTFGKMIESLRRCDEVAQIDLAKKVGIPKSHLCDIEKGRRMVSPKRAAKFAQVMGYSVPQFVSVAIADQLKKARLKLTIDLKAA